MNIPAATRRSLPFCPEVFGAETELYSGSWLTGLDSVYSPEKRTGTNPAVVVAVEDALPGDSIRVCIHDIEPDSIGYTGFLNRTHKLANQVADRDWGYNRVVQ